MGGPNWMVTPPPEPTPLPAVIPTPPDVFTLTPVRLTLCGPVATPQPHTAQGASGLGALEYLLRQQRAISLDFDIDIVFDG